MSKHPWDWGIHFGLCFIPVCFDWAEWFVVLFAGLIVEYEQKMQVGTNHLSWKEYFRKHSLGDLIADALGITIGILVGVLI